MMNERIQKLLKESGIDQNWNNEDFMVSKKEMEKFAELIVRECEKVAKDPQWYGESPSNGWRNPIRHVCNVMKEHFGVEE